MDNEFEFITPAPTEEPEPVPFREKHPNLFWFGVTVATGGALGLMQWLADFLVNGGE